MEETNNKATPSGAGPQPTEPLSVGRKANLDIEINGTRGWVGFLGVVIIISGALAVIFSLLTVSMPVWFLGTSPGSSSWILIVSVLVFCGIAIYVGILLLQSSSHAKRYLKQDSETELLKYHVKMRIFFQVTGIITIIGLSVWLILIMAFSGR
ncbi:MAG: hypothetical protein E3J71_00315 [Candidatus Stahlbacteria bacterium]|nr:MAG: hypothetical protein E3J71_00315 [Candidatus Stahlbacteria bacterium]